MSPQEYDRVMRPRPGQRATEPHGSSSQQFDRSVDEGKSAAKRKPAPKKATPEKAPMNFVPPGDALPGTGGVTLSSAARETLENAPAYSYRYKNPDAVGAGPGRYVGPMAQDLERTPLGASAVSMGPDGMKRVDPARMTMINSAALSNMARELKALRARVDSRRSA